MTKPRTEPSQTSIECGVPEGIMQIDNLSADEGSIQSCQNFKAQDSADALVVYNVVAHFEALEGCACNGHTVCIAELLHAK